MAIPVLEKIVSGGQTGVDRAALDAAMRHGVPCGGWCPRGRLAEDGRIPEIYPLAETGSAEYPERTRRNVEDSDGTLILNLGPLDGGTLFTQVVARECGKPCLVLDLEGDWDPDVVVEWLNRHRIGTLNVAGPRESKRPGTYTLAGAAMDRILAAVFRKQPG